MHNLFGDRFLRLFAGDLQRRQKRSIKNVKDQNPEAIAGDVMTRVDPVDEESDGLNFAQGNDLPDEEEQHMKKDV